EVQSANSAFACWLGTTDPSSLTWTRQLIHKAYTWNDYPAPVNMTSMTNDERIAGLFRLIMIVVALFVTGSIVTGMTFFSMSWTGQHVLRELRLDVFQHLHELS